MDKKEYMFYFWLGVFMIVISFAVMIMTIIV